MELLRLKTIDRKIENELISVYDSFRYHHPFLDPDVLVPIVNNSFSPYFFSNQPILNLIIKNAEDTSIEGYFFSYFSTLYYVLNKITVYYPFVVKSEMLLSDVLERLQNSKCSIEIIPLLDNPYISIVENSIRNFEKEARLRVVSYDLQPDKVARYRMRKAQSNGLTYSVLSADELNQSTIRDFLKCAAEGLKRRGKTIDINEGLVNRWYKTLKLISEKDKGIFIAVYNKNETLVGGAYILVNEKTMFHYIAYNSIEGLRTEAGYLALNVAYKIAQTRHLIVDFGLNPLNQQFVEYKKHWGEYRVEHVYAKFSRFYKLLVNAYVCTRTKLQKRNR